MWLGCSPLFPRRRCLLLLPQWILSSAYTEGCSNFEKIGTERMRPNCCSSTSEVFASRFRITHGTFDSLYIVQSQGARRGSRPALSGVSDRNYINPREKFIVRNRIPEFLADTTQLYMSGITRQRLERRTKRPRQIFNGSPPRAMWRRFLQ